MHPGTPIGSMLNPHTVYYS